MTKKEAFSPLCAFKWENFGHDGQNLQIANMESFPFQKYLGSFEKKSFPFTAKSPLFPYF